MNTFKAGMTLESMKFKYDHIRENDDEAEAIDIAQSALREKFEKGKSNQQVPGDFERAIRSCYSKIRDVKRKFPQSYENTVLLEELKIAALREKAERERGCEYCTKISQGNDSGRVFYIAKEDAIETGQGEMCLAKELDGRWYIHYEDYEDTGIMCDVPTTVCFNCGRRLEPEQSGEKK